MVGSVAVTSTIHERGPGFGVDVCGGVVVEVRSRNDACEVGGRVSA